MATASFASACADRSDRGASDLALQKLRWRPFPHIIRDEFLRPSLYHELRTSFPTCPDSSGPTGRSLYWGDDAYDRLIEEHPAWRSLFDTFHSQAFVDYCLAQFARCWQSE